VTSTVERTVLIRAQPTAVWAVLSDFDAISEWAPNVDHSCLMTEQTEGVGTVRRIQTGRTTLIETVTTWEPEATLSYVITGLPSMIRSVANRWSIEATDGGTPVTLASEIDAGPRPPQQLIARIAGRRLAAASDQMLAGLAAHFADQERLA
jgi:carbon monoxide dehydrogenase subunit G